MKENNVDQKQQKALNRVRQQFRRQCHKKLDEYLSEKDTVTDLPAIDMILAYVGQGWACSVGISLTEAEQETEVESEAKKSGIEIVRA